MEYRRLEGIPNPISRIVFGCAIPSMIEGRREDDLLTAAYEAGVTVFDTAENYGLSEVSLSGWLKASGLRDRITLISKGCHPYDRDRLTPEDLRQDLNQSLDRLGCDCIDIYFLHRDVLSQEVGPILEVLNEYHSAGKIRRFGGSNWTPDRIRKANAYAAAHQLTGFTVSSPYFGLCDQIGDPWGGSAGCVSLSGPGHRSDRDWYKKEAMPVFAYSCLGHGMLSGRITSANLDQTAEILGPQAARGYCYPDNLERLRRTEKLAASRGATIAQIALAWALCHPLDVFALVSSSRISRMLENLAAADIRLTDREMAWLDLEADQPDF